MPWYRPTRVNHVIPGAEFGWRSGWAKWPNYFVDSLPPTLEMGRGSPAGMEVYDHHMFPVRYHNALFVCDWSRGRILAVRTKPHGATYKATAEVFVEGQPLNVTDIAVGPDGWLYFCTGGRDTEGGIYRVVWDGNVPPEVTQPRQRHRGRPRPAAIHQRLGPAAVALVKHQLGDKWGHRPGGRRRRYPQLGRPPCPGARPDATVRAQPAEVVAGRDLARSRRRPAGQGGLPDGPARRPRHAKPAGRAARRRRFRRRAHRRRSPGPQPSRSGARPVDRIAGFARSSPGLGGPTGPASRFPATNGNKPCCAAPIRGYSSTARWPC